VDTDGDSSGEADIANGEGDRTARPGPEVGDLSDATAKFMKRSLRRLLVQGNKGGCEIRDCGSGAKVESAWL
jgi:hypothetical protein